MAAKKEGFTDKLIRLPDEVWAALIAEAKQAKRSLPKQLEALLRERYNIDLPTLNADLAVVGRDVEARLAVVEKALHRIYPDVFTDDLRVGTEADQRDGKLREKVTAKQAQPASVKQRKAS